MYNDILDKPLTTMIDAMASPVNLKLKYHNMHDEPTIINVGFSKAQQIYKALQQDHK